MVILVWGPAKWWYGCLVTGVGLPSVEMRGTTGLRTVGLQAGGVLLWYLLVTECWRALPAFGDEQPRNPALS